MTHKIYLIKHLDTGMGYVGVTSRDLLVRWKQHHSDTNSALYEILRTDSHRMTMELIEEFEDRDYALKAEQEYIQKFGTAQPAGWNRQVTRFYQGVNEWNTYSVPLLYEKDLDDNFNLCCPVCGSKYIIMHKPTVYRKSIEFDFTCRECHKNSYHEQKGPRGGWAMPIVHSPHLYKLQIDFACNLRAYMWVEKHRGNK